MKLFVRLVIGLLTLGFTSAEASPHDPVVAGHSLIVAVSGKTLSSSQRALLQEIQPGGVILMGGNISGKGQTRELVVAIKEAMGAQAWSGELPIIYVDQEGGRVNRMRLDNAPSALSLGTKGDDGRVRETAAYYAREASERGIEVLIAPVLDLNVPDSRAVGDRAFSEDPEIAWLMGRRFIEGIHREGRLPVVKHFPGHGAALEDSHEKIARLMQSGVELEETLTPFRNAVDAGVPAILVGHIACPALDPANPNTPATLSRAMVNGILREQWGYEGLILTDDMNMKAIQGSLAVASVQALQAGCDAVIIVDSSPAVLRAVVQAIGAEAERDAQFKAGLVASRQRLDRFRAFLPRLQLAVKKEATPSLAPDMPFTMHKVVAGDTLSKLASRYGTTTEAIRQLNNKGSDVIRIGETLRIPQ